MILSRIATHGFKSFAKKLELQFDGKVTAIIGPNGCGKTNIVDAIRWGLGEQRPSILRTDRMENVIFGGARSSRPLGMAEVTVVFDNAQRLIPIDYSEVAITRRLFRSGESEYLINKSPVRLKDVTDMLMDTGIGSGVYSILELKMVEDILSEKAEDRRKLLEEAAGVTKYKHRLKAAERKLESTRNDLLRVFDIIQEVERTANSLKRQVQRAQRYRVLERRLKEVELRRAYVLNQDILKILKPLQSELAGLEQKKEGRTTRISKEEADLEALKTRILDQERAISKMREALGQTAERIGQREGDIRVGRERIASLKERIVQYGEDIITLEKRLAEQKSHLEVTVREREEFQVKITSKGRIFSNKKKELEVFQQGLNFKRLDLNAKKKEIIETLEGINQLEREETQVRAVIDNSRGRLGRLDEEDAKYQAARKRVQAEEETLKTSAREVYSRLSAASKERENLAREEESLRKKIDQALEASYRNQGELELLQGRVAFLKNVLETGEGMPGGARKLIHENVPGLVGVLADLIETKQEHRAALETGLGEAAHYVVFDKMKSAMDALLLLGRKGGGKAALAGLDRLSSRFRKPDHPKLPAGVECIGWADELVKCQDRMRPVVHALLGDLLIVKDLESAGEALGRLDDFSVRIATLKGELVTAWGTVHSADPGSADAGLVGRKERIRELEGRLSALKKTAASEEETLAAHRKNLAELQSKKKESEKTLEEIEKQKKEIENQQARIVFEIEKADEGLRNNVGEREKLLNGIRSGSEALESMGPRVESLREKREELEIISGHIQGEVDRLEEEERIKEEEVYNLNLSVVRLNGEAKQLDYDIERSEELIREIQATSEQRRQDIVKAQEQITAVSEETKQNETVILQELKEKEEEEKRLHTAETEYQSSSEELRVREKEVREVRRDRDAASERIHQVTMQVAELQHQIQGLKDRLHENYDLDLDTLAPQEPVNTDEADGEIENLKRKMKGLGSVNLMALGEYEQAKERAQFLNQQRDDLLSAEETLKETILKINQTARQRFGEVFQLVRKNFQETFCHFFQGGEADLRLQENEDPLESQIEIIARPAGKHFRDLSLLSGGERALTAISLLFALYLVKPSPFCILDEIDAPLDDANVERFTRVIREYSAKTQFIVVTHNRMTMKAAETLYGVTMEEEGVSKIVSVRFEE